MAHLGAISAYIRHGIGRRTRHREQIPGVVRSAANDPAVPGGIFWCVDHDLFIITQAAVGGDDPSPQIDQTITAFTYALIWPGIDSGQTLDILNHAYLIIVLPEFPFQIFAVAQEQWARIALRKTVVKVAWVDAHFDLFPRPPQTIVSHPWSLPDISATNPTIVSPDDDPGADWYRYGFDDTVWPDAARATPSEVTALGVPSFAHEAVVIHSANASGEAGRQAWFHRQYFNLEYVLDGMGAILSETTILLRMAGNADITDIYMNEDHVFTADVGDNPPDTAYFVDITNKLGGPFPVWNDRVEGEDLIAFRSDLEAPGRGTLLWQVLLAAQRFSDQTTYLFETETRLTDAASGWNSTEYDDTGWKHAAILPDYTTPTFPDWEDGDFNALAFPVTPGDGPLLITPTPDTIRFQSIDGPQFIELVGVGTMFDLSSTSQFTLSGIGGAHILTQTASDHTHAEIFIAQGNRAGTLTITETASGASAQVQVVASEPDDPGPRWLYVRVWFYTAERDDDQKINLDSNGTIANVYMDGQHVLSSDHTGPFVIGGAVSATYPLVLNKDEEDADHNKTIRARLLAIEAYYAHDAARPDWLVYVVTPPAPHIEFSEFAVWTTAASGLVCVTRAPNGTKTTQAADPLATSLYDETIDVILPATPSMYTAPHGTNLPYDPDLGPADIISDVIGLNQTTLSHVQWVYEGQFFLPHGTYEDGVVYIASYYAITQLSINGYHITENIGTLDNRVINSDGYRGGSPSTRGVGTSTSGIAQPTTHSSDGQYTPVPGLDYIDPNGPQHLDMFQYVIGYPAACLSPNAWNDLEVLVNVTQHNIGDGSAMYYRMFGLWINGAYVATTGG